MLCDRHENAKVEYEGEVCPACGELSAARERAGIPAEGVGQFCVAMTQIGLNFFGLSRAGARLGYPAGLEQNPKGAQMIRQFDASMAMADAALNAGRRIVV